MRLAKRRGKIFVDYLRNGFGATAVCPYSVRPRPGAPVATPLAWSEVKKVTLKPDMYTIKNIFKRLAAKGDPWQHMCKYAKNLKAAKKRLEKMQRSNVRIFSDT
jgi:bifunctional non-homologous end joining protein LigD